MDTATVQQLLDESELRKLILALPRALDERDFDGYGALFTEDAVMEIGKEVRRGRQAIADGPRRDLPSRYEATFHHMGQIYIEVDGDEATILTYQVAYHLPKVSEPMSHEDAGGKYHVIARRTENGWRIARLRLDIVLTQGASLSLDVFSGR
ncbi:nuclear transport factor 2 family protein [Streptomyces chartreusis]|uniref:nuclear transport factor 2 family protein n=1 Tax=Streptomyces chartreusis TaxID=1969 RepID=UPI0033BCAE15